MLATGGRVRPTLVALTGVVVAVRLLLRDPLFDVNCFADCLASPFVLAHATGFAHAVDLVSGPLLVLLVLRRGRPRDVLGPALLATGIALRAIALAIDPQELASRPGLQVAYCLTAAGAATIGVVVTLDAASAFLAQRAVLRLARDLRADATREDLELALRHATGDPTLAIVAHGGTVVHAGEREVVRIAHRASVARVERALGPSIRLALANATLRERLEQRVTRLRATREGVVTLGDAARQSLERDLHDGAQQGVLAVLFELRLRGRPELADEAAKALDELRAIAHGIHPRILSEAGLRPALRQLPADVRNTPANRYPPMVEATVYRVVDEAVQNADPRRVALSVVERDGALITTVKRAQATPDLEDLIATAGGTMRTRQDGFEATIPCG